MEGYVAKNKQKYIRLEIAYKYLRIPRIGRRLQRERAAVQADRFSGDDSERVPPDPISNSEVKTFSADDSVIYSCESRTLPEI